MIKIGIIHANTSAIQPLEEAFRKVAPQATAVNFVNEDLLLQTARDTEDGRRALRCFARLAFTAADAGVDGIIVACSSFCHYVPLMREFLSIPVIAVDRPMLERAVREGVRIGVITTTGAAVPAARAQLEAIAAGCGKQIELSIELAVEAMTALKAGQPEEHDRIIATAGQRLAATGCDILILAQISMARAAAAMPEIGIPVLTSPEEGVRHLMSLL